MIEIVTVKQPVSRIVSDEVERHLAPVARNDDSVLDCVTNLKEVSVEVHWVENRTVVYHSNLNMFTFSDGK